jgi:hypothetical protein
MVCASDGEMRGPAGEVTSTATGVSAAGSAFAALDAGQQRNFDCGCQSCTAVSLPALLVAALPLLVPGVPASDPAALVGIEREPLVPPPQRTL